MELIKRLGERGMIDKQNILHLEEQNWGFHHMHISQFLFC